MHWIPKVQTFRLTLGKDVLQSPCEKGRTGELQLSTWHSSFIPWWAPLQMHYTSVFWGIQQLLLYCPQTLDCKSERPPPSSLTLLNVMILEVFSTPSDSMILVLSAVYQSKCGAQLESGCSWAGLAWLCSATNTGWLSWAPSAALQHSRKQQGSSGCLSLDCFHMFCVCFSSPALTEFPWSLSAVGELDTAVGELDT